MTATQIKFSEYSKPELASGTYMVTVDQTLNVGNDSLNSTTTKTFYVAGERFHIVPSQVKSVYPPPYSLGDYSKVLPHIMLSRNTLPWEREALSGDCQWEQTYPAVI